MGGGSASPITSLKLGGDEVVLYVELCPSKKILKSSPTVSVSVALFGSRVFADDQVKMRSL